MNYTRSLFVVTF